MKIRLIATFGLAAAIAFGVAGCSAESGDDASSQEPNASKGAEEQSAPPSFGGGAAKELEGFPHPGTVELRDTESGLNCSYASPDTSFVTRGWYLIDYMPEEFYVAYGYRNLSDLEGGATLAKEGVFDACLEDILESTDRIEGSGADQAQGVTSVSSKSEDVNGWPMVKVAGTFEQPTGDDAVSPNFVAYTVVNGDAVTWFYVADNTSDKTTPASDLEDLAKRIAQTYRNED